jgi:hypothetical protein
MITVEPGTATGSSSMAGCSFPYLHRTPWQRLQDGRKGVPVAV